MAKDFETAAGDIRLRVDGLAATLKSMEKAGAEAQDMKALMHSLGSIVIRAASPPRQSGALAQSMRAGKGKTKAVVRAGGARLPYAGVVHYGWPARNIRPQEFLSTALQRQMGQILGALDAGIGDILRDTKLK